MNDWRERYLWPFLERFTDPLLDPIYARWGLRGVKVALVSFFMVTSVLWGAFVGWLAWRRPDLGALGSVAYSAGWMA